MKTAVLIFYGLITLVAFWVFLAFVKTLGMSGLSESNEVIDIVLVAVINPTVFFIFMCFALFLQVKLPRISVRLLGQVILCGFLLQLSLGLHGVPNWSVRVGIIFLLLSIAFVFWGVRKLKREPTAEKEGHNL